MLNTTKLNSTSTANPVFVGIVRVRAKHAFAVANVDEKVICALALLDSAQSKPIEQRSQPVDMPGRPPRPKLVSPRDLAHRSLGTLQGRATLIHAVAHIEFNAINLALDAIQRFPDTPAQFALDWAQVAVEEAQHFSLLRAHLQTLGYDYGDFSAHDGLWEMAAKTKHDLLTRLALVPRTLEARGLDVSPAMRDKLAQAGDHRAAEILDIILRDEIGHVAIGNKWFRHYCDEQKLDPLETFDRLWREHDGPTPRPPFNVDARRQAGFVQEEIDWLLATSKK
ncbi:MAG: ferritin-like domain-containing protein [Casimicrobium sp.]